MSAIQSYCKYRRLAWLQAYFQLTSQALRYHRVMIAPYLKSILEKQLDENLWNNIETYEQLLSESLVQDYRELISDLLTVTGDTPTVQAVVLSKRCTDFAYNMRIPWVCKRNAALEPLNPHLYGIGGTNLEIAILITPVILAGIWCIGLLSTINYF